MQMKSAKSSLSVIMPAFNEEQSLVTCVQKTYETLENLNLDFEIILVNDCSSDNTGKIASELSSTTPDTICIHHEMNLGMGGAFRTGISRATKEYVMIVPIDNPLNEEDLEAYLPRLGMCDIIVGSRVERVGYTGFAQFASFVYNRILVPLLFNIGVSDVNWIQIYKRDIFHSKLIEIEHTGIFFLVEILTKAKRNHLIIAEVPSKMQKRFFGKPTCFRISVIWQTFKDMVRFFVNSYQG